ncbi:uncharacterized protein [Aegilops tauschii subsp. strangulata]|uniref:uncharacterized protein n=1 Tax=Aegilops tauschii subsp. strangulata TaxID=200361 RepID=UPI003CC8A59F
MYSFYKAVVVVFGPEYLRESTAADSERLLAINAERGFSGMLDSVDLFARIAEGHCPEVNFEINGHQYNKGYYLADGIYPEWSTLVKTIPNPQEEKRQMFS